jgi:hypothetical protein
MQWRLSMKIVKRMAVTVSMIFFVFSVMMINGCGSNKESKDQGCPSGSFLANSDDKITGPANVIFTGASSFGSPFPGGTVLFTPLVFTVNDATGAPRNKVCVILYTDGFWYTSPTYATAINGTGPLNSIAVATDDFGNAVLYWSTEVLPPANPASIIPPATTLTAGADQKGQSFVQAYSGVLSKEYTVDWTVQGEPAQ